MAGAPGQRLRPFQMDAERCIGVEIEAAYARQNVLVAMTACEFAEAASPVIDAEFKAVICTRLDEIVDEVIGKFGLVVLRRACCRLLAQQGPVFRGHEFVSSGE